MEHHVTFVGCPLKRPAELCVQLLAAETILIHMLMFMLMSSWPKPVWVHAVHLMNADWAPGGCQPSDQADPLWL